MRPRSDTPRDLLQSPTYSINHNVHYPAPSQSPFMPIPHPRIRTESLSSIKSIPANLQPRKKFRTEDQKILDNKRESRERLSNKNVEKSQLRMFDMIYYNPSTNPMKARASKSEEKSEEKPKEVPEIPASSASAAPVPQLRLNAQGELVLDEASLVVENEEHRRNRILLANTNVVYYDEMSTNYGFYKRQKRTREWPHEETVKFYRCLNTVGTDFSLMLNLFPNRTRRDLKLKFKKEEKNNSQLIDKALLKFNTFDIEELQRELEKEDEERKKEAENGSSEVKELVKRKILKKQEAKAKQQQTKSKIEKILADGEEAMKVAEANRAVESEGSKLDIKENFDDKKEKKAVKRKPKPNIAKRRKSQSTETSENTLEPTDTLTCLKLASSMTIKLEARDLKTENVDLIHESMMNEAESEWSSTNVIDESPIDWFPLIDTSPPLIDATTAKIESQVLPVIEESNQVQYERFESDSGDAPSNYEENPSTSTDLAADASFDEESFINSLNLEQLSIVVRQIDGKNIYDIHETNPDTLLISDRPLNIPQHMKDILISVMTQDE